MKKILIYLLLIIIMSCDNTILNKESVVDSENNQKTTIDNGQIKEISNFTYLLSESSNDLTIWTTPVTNKVNVADALPINQNSGINICSAKGEFEPFQIILNKQNSPIKITMEKFEGIGSEQRIVLSKVGFENGWAETLSDFPSGSSIDISESDLTPIWVTVYIPRSASSGDYKTKLIISGESESVIIPVNLHVFNFAIPEKINFSSQFNISINGEEDHRTLYEHRLTPKSPTWPSGFKYSITWPTPYTKFYDEEDQGEDWGIKYLAEKYIHGKNWLGSGYPNAMAFQFVDNSRPRPDIFANISIGSNQYGNDEYNSAWSKYLAALDNYLVNNSFNDEVYYYVMNEPQNQDDYNLAAFLLNLTKKSAPNLRLAISEEPKKEIAENILYPTINGKSYDIWISEVQHYKQDYAWERDVQYGEKVWFYSLPQDPAPYFNPTKVELQGMNQRIIPWVSWHHRVRGWAYYDGSIFFDNNKPNIRLELLREGFEDYEYLFLANKNSHPVPNEITNVDQIVNSVTTGVTSWTSDADAMMRLKWDLGSYIEGTLNEIPKLTTTVVRPKDNYYINFQNPAGLPSNEPLVIENNEYIKVGWTKYNDTDHYGFLGYAIDNSSVQKYNYSNETGFNESQKSYLYDDYGKVNQFEFDLENGKYEVTVGIGRPNKITSDRQNVTVEGINFYNYESGLASSERTKEVTVSDGKLSVVFGDAKGEYTFMAYLIIKSR